MKTPFYLVINNKGSVRTTKTQPGLNWNEISIKMNLELPDSLFKKPLLCANIKVDEEDVRPEVISPEVINNIQESIREHSGIEVRLEIVSEE